MAMIRVPDDFRDAVKRRAKEEERTMQSVLRRAFELYQAADDLKQQVTWPLGWKLRKAVLGLAGAMAHAGDQAQAMTDRELGELLLSGHWTTIEIHEAGRRLVAR